MTVETLKVTGMQLPEVHGPRGEGGGRAGRRHGRRGRLRGRQGGADVRRSALHARRRESRHRRRGQGLRFVEHARLVRRRAGRGGGVGTRDDHRCEAVEGTSSGCTCSTRSWRLALIAQAATPGRQRSNRIHPQEKRITENSAILFFMKPPVCIKNEIYN